MNRISLEIEKYFLKHRVNGVIDQNRSRNSASTYRSHRLLSKDDRKYVTMKDENSRYNLI